MYADIWMMGHLISCSDGNPLVFCIAEIDQLELEVSRMAIDEDSEVEDEPSYLVWYVPRIIP